MRAQNLLPNGSFEDYNICCENVVACSPEGWFGYKYTKKAKLLIAVNPENIEPKSIEKKVVIRAGSLTKQNGYLEESIFAPILAPLQANQWYTFTIEVLNKGVGINQFHLLFTDTFLPNISAQEPTIILKPNRGRFFKEQQGWQTIRVRYQAKGNEKFLFLGQLIDCKNVKYKKGKPGQQKVKLFIDNVSLIPDINIEQALIDSAQNYWYSENRRHDYTVPCRDSRNLFPSLLDKRFNDSLTTMIGILQRKQLVKFMERELSNCYFRLKYINDTALINDSYPQFQPLLNALKADKKMLVRLVGYIGERPGIELNDEDISLKHAMAVKRYFMSKGIPAKQIFVSGEGYINSISYEVNETSYLVDDRVEFYLFK